jgi:hypothetical protein
MQTSSNVEIRIGQLLKCFRTKCRSDFPIARKPALDELCLSINRMKRTTSLEYDFLHVVGTPVSPVTDCHFAIRIPHSQITQMISQIKAGSGQSKIRGLLRT